MVDLFILAGEASGDLQGAKLVEELLRTRPGLKIAAVAGPRMRKFPIEVVEPMESLQVMGFIDVVRALPKIVRLFYSLRKKILAMNPKAFVGVDYPGFNLRLERSLRRKGYKGKLIHYICPTVWAWGKGRIGLMAKNLDLLLTILPFEPKCFEGTGLQVHYVGHPLTEAVANFKPDPGFRARFGYGSEDKILALFPGSRKEEVERNLPLMLKTAEELKRKDPLLKVAISVGHVSTKGNIPVEENYQLMREAHLALAKSGTVALELALHGTPSVVVYAIKPLDVWLATKVFRINLPFYSMPNLLLQKEVFPELFGPNLTSKSFLEKAAELWVRPEKVGAGCKELWGVLGGNDASREAAKRILSSAFSPF